ncbi:MAG: tetratricopeptide repeat protein, partial [Anaerolineae bacterium]|nr:tetratricopeptide repeat protein [Anaerolineae bacterium]
LPPALRTMSSKLDYFQKKGLNPADELRRLIDSLEEYAPKLRSLDSTQARLLLRDLDKTASLFEQLETTELDLVPEQSRFATIEFFYKKNAARILKALGGSETLAEYRPSPPPDRDHWWWYLHELVAEQQRRLLRRIATVVITILVVIVGLVIAFNTILAPSPEAIARLEAENESLAAVEEGDYDLALAAIEKGLTVVPDDASLWLIKGVVQQLREEEDQAVESFDQAKVNLDDMATFHLGLGQLYYRTGQPEKAEEEARTAIELNDKLSTSWLLLGQALEAQDRKFEAIPAYQNAGDIALENGESEVVVLARLALSRVGFGP